MEKNKDLLNIDTSKNDTSKKWRKGDCEYKNILQCGRKAANVYRSKAL